MPVRGPAHSRASFGAMLGSLAHPASSSLQEDFRELSGFSIDEFYGMTEAGAAAISLPAGPYRLATVDDGWEDSGDVMQRDDEGHLWFRGRRNQIIVHDGSNICPQDVEEAPWPSPLPWRWWP